MIKAHIRGRHEVTDFSSWTGDLSWAVWSSRTPDACIAIIDTTRLADHVKVYHTIMLQRAGISHSSHILEYLVYGPISGPAYHCVEWKEFPQMDISTIYDEAIKPFIHPMRGDKHYDLREEDVIVAKNFATRMRRPDDDRPDVIVAITAAVLCVKYKWEEYGVIGIADWALLQAHLGNELRRLRPPATDLAPGSLANPYTIMWTSSRLQQTVDLLLTIQGKVRAWNRGRLRGVVEKMTSDGRIEVVDEVIEADDGKKL